MWHRERPEAKAYFVRLTRLQTPVPGGRLVWYSIWQLYQENKDSILGLHWRIADLETPCRSNLHKFLTGLLFKWDFKSANKTIEVTEEESKYLEIIFNCRNDYKFWKEGLKILTQEGNEKAWDWIKSQVPLLKLRNKLEGRE